MDVSWLAGHPRDAVSDQHYTPTPGPAHKRRQLASRLRMPITASVRKSGKSALWTGRLSASRLHPFERCRHLLVDEVHRLEGSDHHPELDDTTLVITPDDVDTV